MRKIFYSFLSGLLILAMLMSGSVFAASAEEPVISTMTPQRDYDNFSDVAEDAWYYNYVVAAYKFGLVDKTGTSEFSPDSYMPVSQVIIAAACIHAARNNKVIEISNDDKYAPYLTYCTENGLLDEGKDTDPTAPITRRDFAILFAKFLPEYDFSSKKFCMCSDVPESDAGFNAVQKLFAAGYVEGDTATGSFRPDDFITRKEACVVFSRFSDKSLCAWSHYRMITDRPLRVVLASDIHYNQKTVATGGLDNTRMQTLVNSINAENKKQTIDFVIINGDLISLHAEDKDQRIDNLIALRDRYLSQLEMPYFTLRGNHDGYTDEQWLEVFGQQAHFTIETDEICFIGIDVYPYLGTFHFGTDMYYRGTYDLLDTIRTEVNRTKDEGKKAIMVYHFMDWSRRNTATACGTAEDLKIVRAADEEYMNYYKAEPTIIGQVVGHSHMVYGNMEATQGKKANIGTGNFGNVPLSGQSYKTTNGFGYKMLEEKNKQLIFYHLYPELIYPEWRDTSNGERYSLAQAYKTTKPVVCYNFSK